MLTCMSCRDKIIHDDIPYSTYHKAKYIIYCDVCWAHICYLSRFVAADKSVDIRVAGKGSRAVTLLKATRISN